MLDAKDRANLQEVLTSATDKELSNIKQFLNKAVTGLSKLAEAGGKNAKVALANRDKLNKIVSRIDAKLGNVTKSVIKKVEDKTNNLYEANLVQKWFTKSNNTVFTKTEDLDAILEVDSDKYKEVFGDEDYSDQINTFKSLRETVSNSIDTYYKPVPNKVRKNNWVHYFAQDGKLSDEVKTAITAGIYDWIATSASGYLKSILQTHR